MKLHAIDAAIILVYFLFAIGAGIWVSRRGAKDLNSYFLGGKALPWYYLGVSNASGMFDISGTMWLVYVLFIYGLKSIWLPWVWPTFNQIFLMVFVSAWLRRSNVLTGAEWIQTRFGRGTGANLAHLSVVLFALVNVVGMLAYGFKGIGKFADVMLPWHFTDATTGLFSNANIYAIIILSLTSIYAIKGGMVSVVITEVMQFTILTVTSIIIGLVAIYKVSPDMIQGRRARRLDQSVFRQNGGAGLERDLAAGQRSHQTGRQRTFRNYFRPDVFQRRDGQPRRTGAELRYAACSGHAQHA